MASWLQCDVSMCFFHFPILCPGSVVVSISDICPFLYFYIVCLTCSVSSFDLHVLCVKVKFVSECIYMGKTLKRRLSISDGGKVIILT